jgi:hypothetical protein
MILSERLEAQGFPAIEPETTLGLRLPWASVLPDLSEREASGLCGNAMHFSAISSVMLYLLVCTEFVV